MKDIDKKLFDAIKDDNVETFKKYIKDGANIEAKNNYGWTPLIFAAYNGRSECCEILVDAGADTEAKDEDGWTPLICAAGNGHSDCCKTLIDAGADIEAKADSSWTPLMYAVREGNLDCCKMFIDAGADTEAKDNDDWTPLMFAASHGYSDCCKILIDARALIAPKNDSGKTALDYAIECDYKNIIELLKPLITPERELTEHILLNQDIENEVFNNVRIEKMPTISPYYILSEAETNIPVGTFTPNKRLDGLEIYDGFKTLDKAIDNVRDSIDAEVVDNII